MNRPQSNHPANNVVLVIMTFLLSVSSIALSQEVPSDHLIIQRSSGEFSLVTMYDVMNDGSIPRDVIYGTEFPDFLQVTVANAGGISDRVIDYVHPDASISDTFVMKVLPNNVLSFNAWSEDQNVTRQTFLTDLGVTGVQPIQFNEAGNFSSGNLTATLFPNGVPPEISNVYFTSEVNDQLQSPFAPGPNGGPLSNNSDTLRFRFRYQNGESPGDVVIGDVEGNLEATVGKPSFNVTNTNNLGNKILSFKEPYSSEISDYLGMAVGANNLAFSFWSEDPNLTFDQFCQQAGLAGTPVTPVPGNEIRHDPIFPLLFPQGVPLFLDGTNKQMALIAIEFKSDPADIPEPSLTALLVTAVLAPIGFPAARRGLWVRH